MNTQHLTKVITDTEFSKQARIEAIKQLDRTRMQQKELPRLGKIILDTQDQIDVRCYAAATVARADNDLALDLCNELLEQMIGPKEPILINLRDIPSAEKYFAALLEPSVMESAPVGERILVVNTAREIPIEVVDPDTGNLLEGFRLGADGHVTFGVRLLDPSYPLLEKTFSIKVLFVPAEETVYQQAIGDEEGVLLSTVLGLRFDFKLPGFDKYLEKWQTKLQEEGHESVLLPKTTFILSIQWD